MADNETVEETKTIEQIAEEVGQPDPLEMEQEPPDPVEEPEPGEDVQEPEEKAEEKPGKKVVPEATFLELKRKYKEQEQRLAALESRSAKEEEAKIGPTTIRELVESGELSEDDIPTAKQLAMLEANREKKTKLQSTSSAAQTVAQAEAQFRATIPQQHELAGLGVDEVCTSENAENLTGKDWKEFYALPVGSVQRAKFFYEKCIERTPELSNRLANLKPKPKTKLPGTRTSVLMTRASLDAEPSADDILSAVNKGMSEEEFFKSIGS